MYYPHDFHRIRGELYCEQVPVSRIAQAVGTPVYIYSRKTMVEHVQKLRRALRILQPMICFSVKANGNLAILRLMVQQGVGLDVVSGGELYKALHVGCPPSRIVYASVGKQPDEIRMALRSGIFCFNVESAPELEAINRIASRMRRQASVALRINPDVEAHTHRHITTGTAETKFGIDIPTARRLLRHHREFPAVKIIGLHLHIGSQITQARPFIEAIRRAGDVLRGGRDDGLKLPWLNLGGGLGIIYKDEQPQTPQAFARKVVPLLQQLRVRLILEPGRFIVGNAGILLTRVLYLKQARGKRFAVVDAGMNDLLRPALYDAYHEIIPAAVSGSPPNGRVRYDVVGPICESADVLARNRRLGDLEPEQLLAVLGAGAYGSTMASNYNGRPRPAEVLVRGGRWALIRRRETWNDLIRYDRMPRTMIGQ
jgi:diaminopimelate decarboxylase